MHNGASITDMDLALKTKHFKEAKIGENFIIRDATSLSAFETMNQNPIKIDNIQDMPFGHRIFIEEMRKSGIDVQILRPRDKPLESVSENDGSECARTFICDPKWNNVD